jgi:branched-chain amino acid transport system permease protein
VIHYFAQQAINAIQLGSIYALIALGYSMVYGVLTMINFAHGDIFMVGAFFCLLLASLVSLPFVVTLLLVMLATGLRVSRPSSRRWVAGWSLPTQR